MPITVVFQHIYVDHRGKSSQARILKDTTATDFNMYSVKDLKGKDRSDRKM